MAQDRPRRGGRPQGSGGSGQGRPGAGRREQGRPDRGRAGQGRPGPGTSGQGRVTDRSTGGGRPGQDARRSGRPAASRRGSEREAPSRRSPEEQAIYDGPPLDEGITGRELDRTVRQQLASLPDKLATRVARHLVAAGQLIESDPATAYRHAQAARARAPRIAVVREAAGEAAYEAEQFADALAELRAAKRINGSSDYLPVMADCERALGRPEKALSLAKSPAVANLTPALQAEMTIVEAGARRDLGELDGAVRTLEAAPLNSRSRADWVVRLRYAYADALLAAGRREDALVWFHRTAGVDGEGITDAAERLAELEGDSAP